MLPCRGFSGLLCPEHSPSRVMSKWRTDGQSSHRLMESPPQGLMGSPPHGLMGVLPMDCLFLVTFEGFTP